MLLLWDFVRSPLSARGLFLSLYRYEDEPTSSRLTTSPLLIMSNSAMPPIEAESADIALLERLLNLWGELKGCTVYASCQAVAELSDPPPTNLSLLLENTKHIEKRGFFSFCLQRILS